MDRALIFLHIPKAAGSTLREILRRRYPKHAVCDLPDEIVTLSEEERTRIRLLQGHARFGVHTLLPQPADYITMLRDPVERIISLYYYLRSGKLVGDLSFAEFVASGNPQARNDQTRILSGGDEVDDTILAVAKENLVSHILRFGIRERFDESLLLFKQDLGLPSIFYRTQNITRSRPSLAEVPVEIVRRIERENALDLELYDFARRRFEEEVLSRGPAFEDELRRFRQLNRWYKLASAGAHGCARLLPQPLKRILRERITSIRTR